MPELLCNAINKPIKWWNNPVFPLVPEFTYRKGNEYNTNNYSFHWLFFKFWTLDSFDFEISLVCTDHWGIGIIGILPYLRWVVTIPCPYIIQSWMINHLWRKPKK